MESNKQSERVLYYQQMSKFQLVELLKEMGEGKYAYNRTKVEIIRLLVENESRPKPVLCECCQKQKLCVKPSGPLLT